MRVCRAAGYIYSITGVIVMADAEDRTVKKTWKAWRARKVITIHELAEFLVPDK